MSLPDRHVHKFLAEFLKFFKVQVRLDLEEVNEPLTKVFTNNKT